MLFLKTEQANSPLYIVRWGKEINFEPNKIKIEKSDMEKSFVPSVELLKIETPLEGFDHELIPTKPLLS